jgi:hypothetical protein
MFVGVDFDNTIVSYDQVFHEVARERALIPADLPVSKELVRDYLRQGGKENDWTELQGYVYGARMGESFPSPGVTEFFTRCRNLGKSICIISHRTQHPYRGPAYDLHQAAQAWLDGYGFYDGTRIGLQREHVFFERTKEDKFARIARVDCMHFIDDLPEFLLDPGFPPGVERILFDPMDRHPPNPCFRRAISWAEIEQILLGERDAGL